MMRLLAAVSLAALGPAGLAGQTWNDSATTALIARAAARRASAEADTGLRDFEARAHGFVFFLGQLGEGLAAPPRLIKADQLALEVYWKAPGRSKQRIVGWRDRRDLPTDIQYHRDHLGIVTNGFGNRIRIGEGDEVRDVPHPLAPGAGIRGAGAPQGAGRPAAGGDALPGRRRSPAGAHAVPVHAERLPRRESRRHYDRAGQRVVGRPVLAPAAAGD